MQSERALLVILMIILQGVGLVMIYDSSAIYANETPAIHDSDFFLKRQVLWMGFGILAFAALSILDYRALVRNALPIFVASVLSLGLVFVPGIGVKANEAYRWIRLGGKVLQPSEFAKLACILFLANTLSRNQGRSPLNRASASFPPSRSKLGGKRMGGGAAGGASSPFRIERLCERPGPRKGTSGMLLGGAGKLLLPLGGVGVCVGLILIEPNFSSSAVLSLLAFILLFTSGVKLRYLFCLGAASGGVLAYKVYTSTYQLGRIVAFLNPGEHQSGVAYQQTQSLLALGTGGLFGLGLGLGRQKLGFLPYLYNDFVAASVGEQIGFLGMCVLIFLYVLFVVIGFRIALRAKQMEGYLVAVGVSSLIGIQAVLHLGVVASVFPATGLNLPFVSFGGSNLFVALVGTGLLVSVSRVAEKEPVKERARALRARSVMTT